VNGPSPLLGWLPVLPVLLPLAIAAVQFALREDVRAQRVVGVAGALALLPIAWLLGSGVVEHGVLVVTMGGWPAPFGIVFAVDRLGAAMVAITALMAAAVAVYALVDATVDDERAGFHPLFNGLIAGVMGSFVTGDLFNLYVWFEVMIISSFALLAIRADKAALDGGFKYVALNLVGTTLFLISTGLVYGLTGALGFADLAQRTPLVENQGALAAVAFLLMLAFGMKAAVFPVFAWLPASYHAAPPAVAAIFAALLTKVGVYALIRVFTLVFPIGEDNAFGPVLAWIAVGTMVFGVFGAASQWDVRRILSFHIISQIGYMILGLAIATPAAVAGAVFYVLHHIVVKANLFLIAGVLGRQGRGFDVRRMGGLWRTTPLLAVLFLVPALSLAGLPPLSGFWAKLSVIAPTFADGEWALAAAALAVGLLTLYSMLKIWNEAFWKPGPDGDGALTLTRSEKALLFGPIAVLALVTLSIGLYAEPLMAFSVEAAAQLLDREAYVAAVLGGAR
jgi:multicomponent Na+:H+ antiporter subunit D